MTTQGAQGFQVLYDKVLVRRHKKERTDGGLYIPETAHAPAIGTVIAVGHGIPERDGGLRPLTVAVGQTVAWSQFAGQELDLGGEEFIVISEEEILGILPEGA